MWTQARLAIREDPPIVAPWAGHQSCKSKAVSTSRTKKQRGQWAARSMRWQIFLLARFWPDHLLCRQITVTRCLLWRKTRSVNLPRPCTTSATTIHRKEK